VSSFDVTDRDSFVAGNDFLRRTSEADFLTAELLDSRPDLRSSMQPLYAATAESFERLLREAQGSEPVFVFVDGIDHISRVFAQSQTLAGEDIDIVEQLGLLRLPENTHLIIGSQPGTHLAPLISNGNTFELPSWTADDISLLAEKTALKSGLSSSGHGELIPDMIVELDQRAEGNPLYATFICREMLNRLSSGTPIDPVDEVRRIPVREGDLGKYYSYLLQHVQQHHAVIVAETLALLDFGISKTEHTIEAGRRKARRCGSARWRYPK